MIFEEYDQKRLQRFLGTENIALIEEELELETES